MKSTTNDPAADARIEAMIAAARAYLGVAYRVGTEGPDTIDCSGLVFRAFSNAAELNQVGGLRMRAAGYLRWFAAHNLLTTDPEDAERGDLVIYGNGEHIGIYLGDGRVISALITGVTVHSLAGITVPPTGFLAVDWTGKRGPFKPGHIVLPTILDTPEAPAALVPTVAWAPETPAEEVAQGPAVAGEERTDLRTANSRTYDDDGQFTTELLPGRSTTSRRAPLTGSRSTSGLQFLSTATPTPLGGFGQVTRNGCSCRRLDGCAPCWPAGRRYFARFGSARRQGRCRRARAWRER